VAHEIARNDRAGGVAMLLTEHQRLPTSGARAVAPFTVANVQYLAVPQLARDMPDTPAHMNGGDSDIGAPIYRWSDGRFVEDSSLPLTGGEDIAVFTLGGAQYLVAAGVRTGHGPYEYNIDQVLYRRAGSEWKPVQTFPGFAAKQWSFFEVAGRSFLALAQGVTLGHIPASNPRCSRIFVWDGSRFVDFQTLDGLWGYNWEAFAIGGRSFLCYADHVGASAVLEWTGTAFVPFQTLSTSAGRCFRFFDVDGEKYLAFASIQGNTVLTRWDGDKFAAHQVLSGPGGRELCVVRAAAKLYLVQINFIEGQPAAPVTNLMSRIYGWDDGRLHLLEEFPTAGGTDAATFQAAGVLYLAVSNSLTPDVRFRTDSVIYRFNG
jgi:EPTP domain-containing protein